MASDPVHHARAAPWNPGSQQDQAAEQQDRLPSEGGALQVRVDARSAAVDLRVPAGVAGSIAVEPSSSGFVGVDRERFETVVEERQYRHLGSKPRLETETHVSAGAITIA